MGDQKDLRSTIPRDANEQRLLTIPSGYLLCRSQIGWMDSRAVVNEGSAMRVLDLFSGIGGFSLGLERAGMETVAFCEYDDKARQVLKKHWPDVPQYNDVRTLTKEQLDNDGIKDIGLICGGYPCQPFSTAGKRQGEADDRALWKEYFRLIKEIRPTWVIAENVAGHISMGLDNVLADLESEDYAVQTFVIPACAVDAKHRRDRVWIVGHAEHNGPSPRRNKRELQGKPNRSTEAQQQSTGADRASTDSNSDGCYVDDEGQSGSKRQTLGPTKSLGEHRSSGDRGSNQNSGRAQGARVDEQSRKEDVAHTSSDRLQGSEKGSGDESYRKKPNDECVSRCGGVHRRLSVESRGPDWFPEPSVGRVAHGVPGRVDRLKQLGNAVVPQIPEMIGRAILNDC